MNAAIETVRCCVKCDECADCYTHSLSDIRTLLVAIKKEISDFGIKYSQKINWGYSCKVFSDESIRKLLVYKDGITQYYHGLRQKSMSCLCDTEFQKLKEKVLRIIDIRRCKMSGVTDIAIDRSGYDGWVINNPSCVAYNTWEKGFIKCLPPSFLISATKSRDEGIVRTLYALVSNDHSKCLIKLLAYASKAMNDGVTCAANINKQFKALVTKHDCDMSISVYSELIRCSLSFNLISTILQCGGKFSLNKNGVPQVKIGTKVTKVSDLIKLAGGTMPEIDNEGFNNIYS